MRVVKRAGARERRPATFSSTVRGDPRVASLGISRQFPGREPPADPSCADTSGPESLKESRPASSWQSLVHPGPFKSLGVVRQPLCYARPRCACRFNFVSLVRWFLRVARTVWCLLTITRCRTVTAVYITSCWTLFVDRSDGHDPDNAGNPRLRRFTIRSRVQIPWVTSHFTSDCRNVVFLRRCAPPRIERCHFGSFSRDYQNTCVLCHFHGVDEYAVNMGVNREGSVILLCDWTFY